jgi:hypothetical protein
MASLQDALIHFNTDKPAWYGWIDSKDGEVYSNIKLLDDTATMPSEAEVNAKIAELKVIQDRILSYGSIGDQLDLLYHDMTAGKGDKTGEWYKAVKKVKDDNPKPS